MTASSTFLKSGSGGGSLGPGNASSMSCLRFCEARVLVADECLSFSAALGMIGNEVKASTFRHSKRQFKAVSSWLFVLDL